MERQKIADRRMLGAMSRRRGERFEALIDLSCEGYRISGKADIEKTPEPMKVVRPIGGGKFLAAYEKKAQADYKGVLYGGRAVFFEAKSTERDRMLQSRVTENQAERLNRAQQMGAAVFVLCEIRGRYFRVPWIVWNNMKTYFGRKYITQADAARYEVKIGKNGALEFLEGIDE